MYPYIRYFRNIIKAKSQPKLENPFQEVVATMRVMPWDLDMFVEMNNGRYLTIMDTGRSIMGQRVGLFKILRNNKWGLMVAAVSSRFRYRLKPFVKFTLHTKMIHYSDRWFYFHQWFQSEDGKINASFLVKTGVTSKDGIVTCQKVIQEMGFTEEELKDFNKKGEWIEKWEESDFVHKDIMEGMRIDSHQ